jgi:hypothetical protein
VRVWDLMGDKTVCIEFGDHKFAIDSVVSAPSVSHDGVSGGKSRMM